MPRYMIKLASPAKIAKARGWFDRAASLGWIVEFREDTRTNEQNARLWEMLGRVAKHMTINGKAYDADAWKFIFMKAMGREVTFLPTLDGESFFPSGFRSSQLTKVEMSDLQTMIEVWCAERGFDIWADDA